MQPVLSGQSRERGQSFLRGTQRKQLVTIFRLDVSESYAPRFTINQNHSNQIAVTQWTLRAHCLNNYDHRHASRRRGHHRPPSRAWCGANAPGGAVTSLVLSERGAQEGDAKGAVPAAMRRGSKGGDEGVFVYQEPTRMRLPWLPGDDVVYVTDDGELIKAVVVEEVVSRVEMRTAGGMIVTGRIDRVFRYRSCPHDAPLWLMPPSWIGRDLLWPVDEAG